jgi:hypothetical protein
LYRRDLTVSSLKPAAFNVSNQQSTSCAHATGITIFFAMPDDRLRAAVEATRLAA